MVGSLGPEPSSINRVGKPGLDVAERVARALGESGNLKLRPCIQIQSRQRGIQIEQLLEMRLLPIARGRITEEAAVHGVIKTAPAHSIERRDDDPFVERVLRVGEQLEGEVQRRGKRELRFAAEAAVIVVE